MLYYVHQLANFYLCLSVFFIGTSLKPAACNSRKRNYKSSKMESHRTKQLNNELKLIIKLSFDTVIIRISIIAAAKIACLYFNQINKLKLTKACTLRCHIS